MANDLNKGADSLLARIAEEAKGAAEQTAESAQTEINRIKELAQRDVSVAKQDAQTAKEKAKADILERSRTNAELDSRKYALAAKRTVVEDAFKGAYDALCALGGAEREEMLKAMAIREAVGGEKVAPAQADADHMKRLLPAINEALKAKGIGTLAMGEVTQSIKGGFLLVGNGFEKNCSFEAILRDVREAEESKVAQILFG